MTDPRSRKVTKEVALRWRQGQEVQRGIAMAQQSWDKAGQEITLWEAPWPRQIAQKGRANFLDGHTEYPSPGEEGRDGGCSVVKTVGSLGQTLNKA